MLHSTNVKAFALTSNSVCRMCYEEIFGTHKESVGEIEVARNTTGWKEFDAERPDARKRKNYKQVRQLRAAELARQRASCLHESARMVKGWLRLS